MRCVLAASAIVVLASATAQAQDTPALSEAATAAIGYLNGHCERFDYDEDCIEAVKRTISAVSELSDEDKEAAYTQIRFYREKYPHLVETINKLMTDGNVPLEAA